MKEDKRILYGFGYGLALLIPFLVWWHGLDVQVSARTFFILVMYVGLIFYIISKISNFNPKANLWIYGYQALVLFTSTVELHLLPLIFLGLAVGVLTITLARVELLSGFYRMWMKGARFIGETISTIALIVIFYLVFSPVGIILKGLRKDLLDQKIDKGKKSYWILRKSEPFSKERCTKQF